MSRRTQSANVRESPVQLTILAGLWTTAIWIGLDMYLPAMPHMDDAFDTSETLVNLTLLMFSIGLPIGALVGGALSDKMGRWRPTIAGGAVFAGSCILCALSPSIFFVIALRLLTGLGGGVVCATIMAVLKDCLEGTQLERSVTVTQSLAIVGPLVAPLLGSLLLELFSWQAIFIALALLGFACLLWYLRVGETLPPEKRADTSLIGSLGLVAQVARNKHFTVLLIALCMPIFSFGAFAATCSYVYIDTFGLANAQFSLLYTITCAMAIGGPFIYAASRKKLGDKKVILMVCGMLAVSGLWTLALGPLGPIVFMVGTLPFNAAEGMARPCAYLVLLQAEDEHVGSASALIHFGLGVLAALGTAIGSLPWPDHIVATGVPILFGSIVGFSLIAVLLYAMKSRILD